MCSFGLVLVSFPRCGEAARFDEMSAAGSQPSRRSVSWTPAAFDRLHLIAMVRRVTGLQRQVYSLYKRSLKMIASKPLVSVRNAPSSACSS